jgi:hypothetical protein
MDGARCFDAGAGPLLAVLRGKSRMREIRLSGSVRGAGRKVRPYRDPLFRCVAARASAGRAEALDGGH